MKTRKTIAAEAEQVMVDFARVYSPKGKKMDALIKQTQADLAARQVAPQQIIEKFMRLRYELILRAGWHISPAEEALLTKMAEISRERSFLPFKRYDPWF